MTKIHPDSLIALDADGVFMNEMTYWRTALAAAFHYSDIEIADASRWQQLDDACLHQQRLQFITKSRGCNSNWDLAAVIALVLSDADTKERVRAALAANDDAAVASTLATAMEARWSDPDAGAAPVSGFGIDRSGKLFTEVRDRFQDVLYERCGITWSFPRHELIPPADATRGALARMRDAGKTITVCTSRQRDETETPIRRLELAEYFDCARMMTLSEAHQAQRETGVSPLGKPHWFPLAAIALGYDRAVRAVRDNAATLPADGTPILFMGDAPADFETARGCHARGLPVAYIHIDSGITRRETLDAIAKDDVTVAVVDTLAQAADIVLGATP
ncbi:MAG: HAD family hydrolase [Phycisphaerales bacterium]|nr:HAD family hydrolase [Phycisphaerales bacterium]